MLPVPFDSTDERGHRGQLARAIAALQKPRAAFAAYLSAATTNNKTGDSTPYDVVFDIVDFDTGSNYAAGIFTAKETGTYLFSAGVGVANLGAAHTIMDVWLLLGSGAVRILGYGGSYNSNDGAGFVARGGSTIVLMNVGDTAKIRMSVAGSTKTVGVDGGTGRVTYFSGARVG